MPNSNPTPQSEALREARIDAIVREVFGGPNTDLGKLDYHTRAALRQRAERIIDLVLSTPPSAQPPPASPSEGTELRKALDRADRALSVIYSKLEEYEREPSKLGCCVREVLPEIRSAWSVVRPALTRSSMATEEAKEGEKS